MLPQVPCPHENLAELDGILNEDLYGGTPNIFDFAF